MFDKCEVSLLDSKQFYFGYGKFVQLLDQGIRSCTLTKKGIFSLYPEFHPLNQTVTGKGLGRTVSQTGYSPNKINLTLAGKLSERFGSWGRNSGIYGGLTGGFGKGGEYFHLPFWKARLVAQISVKSVFV